MGLRNGRPSQGRPFGFVRTRACSRQTCRMTPRTGRNTSASASQLGISHSIGGLNRPGRFRHRRLLPLRSDRDSANSRKRMRRRNGHRAHGGQVQVDPSGDCAAAVLKRLPRRGRRTIDSLLRARVGRAGLPFDHVNQLLQMQSHHAEFATRTFVLTDSSFLSFKLPFDPPTTSPGRSCDTAPRDQLSRPAKRTLRAVPRRHVCSLIPRISAASRRDSNLSSTIFAIDWPLSTLKVVT